MMVTSSGESEESLAKSEPQHKEEVVKVFVLKRRASFVTFLKLRAGSCCASVASKEGRSRDEEGAMTATFTGHVKTAQGVTRRFPGTF
jgi:hypothetical protein